MPGEKNAGKNKNLSQSRKDRKENSASVFFFVFFVALRLCVKS